MEHQSGAFCHSSNYPIGATINVLGNANNNCACLMEWRKAAWNVLRGMSLILGEGDEERFVSPIHLTQPPASTASAVGALAKQVGIGWLRLRRQRKARLAWAELS